MPVVASFTSIKFAEITNNGNYLILAGDNHPIVKFDIKENKEIAHSEFPVLPGGLSIDSTDKIWVHNFINHKLTAFDSMLINEKDFEAPEHELFAGNSSLWASSDRSKVLWYKGDHECLVMDSVAGDVSTEIDYLVDECDLIVRISELTDLKSLLVITNSKSLDGAVLNRVVQQGADYKITKKSKYSEVSEGSICLARQRQSSSRQRAS